MAKYLINSNDIDIEEVTGTDNLKLNISGANDVKDWTPSLANASATYSIQTGKYVKIGKLVFIWFRMRGTINSVSSPAYAYINGLPYSCAFDTAGSLFEHRGITNDDTRNVLLRVVNKQLAIQKDDAQAGVSIESWYASENTFYLGGSAVYYTNV
jgi:hypothetical protein